METTVRMQYKCLWSDLRDYLSSGDADITDITPCNEIENSVIECFIMRDWIDMYDFEGCNYKWHWLAHKHNRKPKSLEGYIPW